MPIGILNNIPSLSAENALTQTSNALNSTLQQLSSGSRINSGADDPAGLSIANGLSANIAALSQSVSNANDGVGELQLADGALAQVTNLLNTAVTLATEAATGTVSNAQRTAIQAQYASILAEVNQIGTATTYNGQSVFQGGSSPNLNAAVSANSATTAPLNLNTVLTVGTTTSVSAGGVTFSYTAASTGGANTNEVTGSGTGLTAASVLQSGTVVTATRATGTTIYTATAATTVGALENAINTGAAVTGITVTGTDATHTGYQAALNAAGSLQITDLNNNNDLAVAETGTNQNQVTTNVGNLTASTALGAGAVLTLTRAGGTSIYTVQAGGSTVGALESVINTGTSTAAIVVSGTDVHTGYTAALSGGNLQITDGTSTDNDLTAAETGDTNLNEVTSGTGALTTGTALGAGDVFTATRNGAVTTYTVGASGSTVASLLSAINTGVSVVGTGGTTATGVIVGGGGVATNYSAALVGGHIQVTDGNSNKDVAFVETGAPNYQQITTSGGTDAGATDLANGDVLTLTRGGLTSVYTVTGGTTTFTQLAAVIQSGVGANGVAITGTDVHSGYTASITGGNNLQITTTGAAILSGTQTTGTDIGALTNTINATTTGTYTNTLTDGTLGAIADNPDNTLGTTFTANAAATSTVQNLINAINSDTTVGAKATLTNGQVVVTDPQGRADLTVTTTDTLLGALVQGAATNFTTPTTTAAASPNLNELIGNAGNLTASSALTNGGVSSFAAGGKTFSFTANTTNGLTVGALIAAINNPSDTAGLQAYLSNGNLEVVDPNNNDDVAVSPTNTETTFGTFTNPSTTASTTTNIFLSDSTAIGSTQIAVSIGGLTTTGITNGSGGNSVDLASTDLNTATDAQNALTKINTAITNVASVRGTLGASVNRLSAASNVINSQVENLTSAENTITAADIPTVVANLTKYSILEQTGISALAQANQQQQLVLKLLQ